MCRDILHQGNICKAITYSVTDVRIVEKKKSIYQAVNLLLWDYM